MRFIMNFPVFALAAARVRSATTRLALFAGLCAFALPGLSWADDHCDSVTAGAVGDRSDVQTFVECAHAYALQHGRAEAARAFREDERWRDGSIYLFVDRQGASGSAATSYVFPPDPAREGRPWGPLVDEFGSDYFVETNRIFNALGASGAGWTYYSFTNPATGRSEPKASYLMALEWNGEPALIGAGLYERDIPATCYAEDVNALQLDTAPDDDTLAQFVRCASMVVERKGFFGVAELTAARWRSGSVYVFGVDAESGVQLFTTSPETVNGMQLMEGLDDRDPTGRFAGRDAPAVGSAFDEAFLYYEGFNPETGTDQGKVTFVKKVTVQGTPVLVGSGYYPEAAAPAAGAPSGEAFPYSASFESAPAMSSGEPTPVQRAAVPVLPAPLVPRASSAAPVESWTNTVGMDFVWIRPGTFQMGSPKDEKGRRSDEVRRPVRIGSGYWLGTHEVTRGEWLKVMGSLPPNQPKYCDKECPVVGVSWEDTQEFIRRLERRESVRGYRYRLPTEAEWEFAARAGTTGARYGALDKIAWYAGNSSGKVTQVGYKQANAWGLHDMLGNVREWTADWYGPYRTHNGFATDSPTGPSTGSQRVLRGGSFSEVAQGVRAADRRKGSPSARSDDLGFRLVRSDALTLVPGLVWKNTLGAEFAWIPPGTFQMGSPESEEGRESNERQHEVTISAGFWMGRYEVTEAEWEAVMGTNPAFPGCSAYCPVNLVRWGDVQEFIRRLNQREPKRKGDERAPDSGYVYRLPTEAEWEYAARAGTTGARYGELDAIAWYLGTSGKGRRRLHEVGQKQANAWGLHDMLGNVQEWTSTRYHQYPSGPVTDPMGPKAGLWRVIRGGAIHESAWLVRAAYRLEGVYTEIGSVVLGLRLVRGTPLPPLLPPPPSPVLVPGATWTNSVGMEFAGVPAGKFQMGSPADEVGRANDEVQHEVTISKAYWMGKYEVTRREWEGVMGSSLRQWRTQKPSIGCSTVDCPLGSVTWEEVQEFIAKLNERESGYGYTYRLPTEAEWEYAARAGTTGARYGEVEEVALWFAQSELERWDAWLRNPKRDPDARPTPGPTPSLDPVGQKRANAWGLHDMLGSVWEWTADWYGAYPSSSVTDPLGPTTGMARVGRGGDWSSSKRRLRSATRAAFFPGEGPNDSDSLGFRLVRTD